MVSHKQVTAALYRSRLGLLSVVVAVAACQTTSNLNLRTNRGNAENQTPQGATDIPTATPSVVASPSPLPNVSTRQFRVLDPGYDYNLKDDLSAAAMAQRHPVYPATSSQIAILHDPSEYYQARVQLLDQATRSVRVQALLFESDESGRRLTDKLVALAKRGIQVTMIVDPVANFQPRDQRLYNYLKNNGIRVEGYEFLYMNYIRALNNPMTNFGITVSDANMRYHEKFFIIDGELPEKAIAITGGTNVGNEYFGIEPEEPLHMWFDKDVMLKGDVVANMTEAFDINVQTFEAETAAALQHTPATIEGLWGIIATLMGDKIERPGEDRPLILSRLEALERTPLVLNWMPIEIRFLHSRPRFKEDLILPAYVDFIDRANEEILILNSYFIPDEDFITAIIRAARRGVKVRIMTNDTEVTDIIHLSRISRTYYKRFLDVNIANSSEANPDHEIEIYEWAGDPKLKNGLGQNHSKYAIFDRKAAIVGSYNLDPRSRYLDSEDVVVFEGAEAVAPLLAEYEKFIGPQYAIRVTPEMATAYAQPDSVGEVLKLQFMKYFESFL